MDEECRQLIERLESNLGDRATVAFLPAGPTDKLRCLDDGRLEAASRIEVVCPGIGATFYIEFLRGEWRISGFISSHDVFKTREFRAAIAAFRLSGVNTHAISIVIQTIS